MTHYLSYSPRALVMKTNTAYCDSLNDSLSIIFPARIGHENQHCVPHKQAHLLEPGLVDTPLARREFARFGIDWSQVQQPGDFALEHLKELGL